MQLSIRGNDRGHLIIKTLYHPKVVKLQHSEAQSTEERPKTPSHTPPSIYRREAPAIPKLSPGIAAMRRELQLGGYSRRTLCEITQKKSVEEQNETTTKSLFK